MPLPHPEKLSIYQGSDASEARRLTRAMGMKLGFNSQACEELAIVASELATNLVKHAGGGQLLLSSVEDGGRLGIKIESYDTGSGIADIDQAITDGFSSTGSLGYGLGTVNRLMDNIDVRPRGDGKNGLIITCQRWRRDHFQRDRTCPLSFGVATRPRMAMTLNGDAFVVEQWNHDALIALIDGLGHGPDANRAALAAREYVENHYDQPFNRLFQGVNRACRATRGVVMALARFNWKKHPITMSYASIGNIEARVFECPAPKKFAVQRGIIGYNAPDVMVSEFDWDPSYVLVLHSDGLNSQWHWQDYPELTEASATQAARYLLQIQGRDDDDASIIVVRKS